MAAVLAGLGVGKPRDSTQIDYRLQGERVSLLCRAVCTQVAIELDAPTAVPVSGRLLPIGVGCDRWRQACRARAYFSCAPCASNTCTVTGMPARTLAVTVQ